MFKGNDVLRKAIVSFTTGRTIARVRDILFDPEGSRVVAFVIDNGGLFREARVVPYASIKNFGQDALMVHDERAVAPASFDDGTARSLRNNMIIRGTKVISEDGKNLGTIRDIYFDEITGKLEGYEVSGGIFSDVYTGTAFLPALDPLTIGRDVAVVSSETAEVMAERRGGLKEAAREVSGDEKVTAAKERAQAGVSTARERSKSALDRFEVQAEDAWDKVRGRFSELRDEADVRVTERRIKAALGRPVNRVILDNEDNVILNTGELITNQAIQKAKEKRVLDMLLNSVDMSTPTVTREERKAPQPGQASLKAT